MALAGEAQITADQTYWFRGVAEQIACLFQAASGNEFADGESEFFFEIG